MSTRATLLGSARQGTHPPITVAECQAMLDRVPTMIWSGADGGYTSPAPDGRRTWWFGDTVSVNGWLHNSTMIQTDGVLVPDTRTVIPKDEETGTVYWPAHAALLPDGRLLVPCGGLVSTADWFENRPMRAAYVTVGDDGRVEFDAWLPYWPEGMDGGNAAQRFDSVVYDHGTGLLHCYARPADSEDGFIKGVYHSSVPLEDVDTPAAWSAPVQVVDYVTDGSWSPWIDADTGLWHSVTMSLDTRTVLVYTAEAGEGPWEQTEAVPSPWEPDGTDGEFFYVLHAHPWLTIGGARGVPRELACTVSHTSDAGGRPHDYRPRFLSVPYPAPPGTRTVDGVTTFYSFDGMTASTSGGVVTLTVPEDVTTSTPSPGLTRLTW